MKERNQGIDYLRLTCMMMVVSMHYFGWGGVINSSETSKLNFIIASGISVFCRVAVNCFILITGYFISEDNSEIQMKKITIPIKKHYKKIWFYSVFIFLLCIKPFLGKLLFQLSEKELKILLLSIAFFDIIQSTLGHNGFSERGTGVLHCTFMLILGYGIHHLPCLKMKGKKAIFIYGSSCLLAGIIAFGEKALVHSKDAASLYYNSPLIVLASIAFMNIFLSYKLKGVWVSKISSHVLAIYLINDHPIVREYVWEKILCCNNFYNSNFMIIHWIFCVIMFTVLGIGFDCLISKINKLVRLKG